jgi:ABC-type transport system substrate-binding protein/class 3 adenylate cyclase
MSEVGDLRLVTVLVTDIVDSTPIGERLGPERSKPLFDEVSRLLGAQVERFGGIVAQHTGDGLLAFFGAPVAHGDDAERAVRAALAMQAALQPFAQEVATAYDITLSARVAINTGYAAVPRNDDAAPLDALYNALGDTVTVAGRLQSFADPGGVVVGPISAAELVDQFAFDPMGDLELKGKSEPVPAFRLIGERVAAAPPITKLVGREAELETLTGLLGDAMDGRGAVVVITGEPGIGKSRLIEEARVAVAGPAYLEGHGVSYQETAPYWPVHGLLRGWLGLEMDAPDLQLRLELRARLAELLADEAPRVYPFVALLLGLTLEPDQASTLRDVSAESVREQTFAAFDRLLVGQLERTPLFLVMDDLHWADEATLALLEHLLDLTDEHALVVVLSFRSERDHAAWALGQRARSRFPHRFTEISLAPLDGAAATVLANDAAGAALPEDVAVLLNARCGGNPFFIEQAVLDLVERGSLARQGSNGYEITNAFDPTSIPVRVQETLQARLDRLDPPDRDVLCAASVIGRTFGLPLLEQVVADPQVMRRLAALQRLEFVVEKRRRPTAEFNFRHGLVRDIAYSNLLEQPRRSLHQRVGVALQRLSADGSTVEPGLLAGHFANAGDAARASEYLLQAGDQARALFAEAEAVDYYQRALPFLRELGDAARERETLFRVALTLFLSYDFVAANAAYQAAFDLPAPDVTQVEPTATLTLNDLEPESLVPGVGYGTADWWLSSHVVRGLFRLDRESSVAPDMATRFGVSPDGLTVDVEIADTFRWHDGVPVIAADYVFAWQESRAMELQPSPLLASMTIEAPTPTSLVIRLERPLAHLPYLLSFPPTHPWPSHLGRPEIERDLRVTPLGNGPYRMVEWTDDQIRLEAAPSWTGDRGNIGEVRVTIGGAAALTARQVTLDINTDPYGLRASPEDLEVATTTRQDSTHCLAFSPAEPPFDDVRVRRALALAIDRTRLDMDYDNVPALGGVIPPTLPGHLSDSGLDWDPSRAAGLLAEAGYPEGRGLRPVRLLRMTEWQQTRRTFDALVEMWSSLGIEVADQLLPQRDLSPEALADFDVFGLGWVTDFPDPEGMIGSLLEVYRGVVYSDDISRSLDRAASSSATRGERFELYRQLDRYLVSEQVTLVPLNYGLARDVVRPWVRGFWRTPLLAATADQMMIVDRPGT